MCPMCPIGEAELQRPTEIRAEIVNTSAARLPPKRAASGLPPLSENVRTVPKATPYGTFSLSSKSAGSIVPKGCSET
jgi:hypothetical protein